MGNDVTSSINHLQLSLNNSVVDVELDTTQY